MGLKNPYSDSFPDNGPIVYEGESDKVDNSRLTQRPKWLRVVAFIFLIVPLFPLILFRSIQLVRAEHRDDPDATMQALDKTHKLSALIRGPNVPMSRYHRSLRAKMMVLQNRLEDGHREFAQLREDLQGRDFEESKYLLHFAQYWLAQLRNDFGQSEFELKQANKLTYRSGLLWLPEPKGPDSLDLGFDQELLEAAEDAGMTVEEFVRQQVIKS